MTDFDADELVSAVLDGEATDAERAQVDTDPVLSERLEELRAVRDALAVTTTLPSDREREAAITAAIRSAPVDLQSRRQRRSRLVRVAAIAAAVLAFAGIAAGIAGIAAHRSHTSGASVAASPSTGAPSTAAESPESAATAGEALNPDLSVPASSVTDLGPFATRDALVSAVERATAPLDDTATASTEGQTPQGAFAPSASTPTDSSCTSRQGVRLFAHAELGGQPVIVVVTNQPGAGTIAVYDTSCNLIFSQPA